MFPLHFNYTVGSTSGHKLQKQCFVRHVTTTVCVGYFFLLQQPSRFPMLNDTIFVDMKILADGLDE